MTVVYPQKFRKLRVVEASKSEAKGQSFLAEAVMDILGDLQSATSLLTDLGTAMAKGMNATPQDIGNAEIIVSQLRALIRTAGRSPRSADQHLSRLLKMHLQKIEEEIACPTP